MAKNKHGWNDKNTNLSLTWMVRAAHMERNFYKKFRRLSALWAVILFVQVVINAAGSAFAILGLGSQDEFDPKVGISGILVLLNLLATIISAIIATFKFSKNIETLRYSITKFSKLIRTIEKVVNMDTSRRPDADDFLSMISDKYYKYHSSNHLLAQEMMNFRNIRQKISDATSYNQLSPEIIKRVLQDEEDDDSNGFSAPVGLFKELLTKTKSKIEDEEREPLNEIHIEMKDIEDHDFIKGEYVGSVTFKNPLFSSPSTTTASSSATASQHSTPPKEGSSHETTSSEPTPTLTVPSKDITP